MSNSKVPVVMCILFHNSRLDRLIDQRVSQSGFIFLSWNRKNPQPSRMKPFSAFYPSVPDKCFFFLLFFEYRHIFFQRLSRTFLTPVTVYRYSSLILTVLISLFRKGTFSSRLVWTEFDNSKTITISAVRSPDCYDYSILPYRKRILWKKKIRDNLLSQMFIL